MANGLIREKETAANVPATVSGIVQGSSGVVSAGSSLASTASTIASSAEGAVSLMDKLNSFSKSVLEIGTAEQKQNAKNDAISAVMDGTYVPRTGSSPYSQTFNAVGNESYMTTAKNKLNKSALNNYNKYQKDPERFLSENAKAMESEISKAPSKELQFLLTQNADATTTTFSKNLIDKRAKLGVKKEMIGLKNNIAINSGTLISKMGRGADPTSSVEALQKTYNAMIDNGLISPEGAEEEIRNIVKKGEREFYLNTAAQLSPTEAKKYLTDLKFDQSFTADEKVEIRNSIKSEVNSRELKRTQAETTIIKINDETVKGNIKVLESGSMHSEPIDPTMKVTPKVAAQYRVAMNNYSDLVDMSKLPIDKQSEKINRIDASTPAGLAKKNYLEKQHKKFTQGNLIETAQEFKMMDADFVSVNSDIGDFKRREAAQVELSAKYGRDSEFFTSNELSEMQTWNETATATDKIVFLNKINDLDDSQNVIREISKKASGNLAFAGELVKRKQVSVAQAVLEGAMLDNQPPKKLKSVTNIMLGEIISRGSANDFNAYSGAAVNYSKARLAGGVTVSPEEAIEATSGKIASYNGRKIFLPMGVSKSGFDSFLSNYTNPNEGLQKDIRALADFFDGSIQLHYTGRGKYQVYYPNIGRYVSQGGKLLEIDYHGSE